MEKPEAGSEGTANDLNELSKTGPTPREGGDDGHGGTNQIGIEYEFSSDNEGITTWTVIKQADGRIDTIKYGGNKSGKPLDTVKGKKP